MCFKKLLLTSLFLTSNLTYAYEDNELKELETRIGDAWVLVKDDKLHHIKTWMKQEDHKPIRSFRMEAIFTGNISDYIRMELGFDEIKKWFYGVTESKLLKKISNTEYIAYRVHNAPLGLPDRDAILHVTFVPQTPSKDTIEIKVNSLENYLPLHPPYIRMKAENYTTTLTPLTNGQYKQETEGFIDPGGNDLKWLINFIQRTAPYNTEISIYRRLQQNTILDKTALPFIVYDTPQ